jgi:hypothetical protein
MTSMFRATSRLLQNPAASDKHPRSQERHDPPDRLAIAVTSIRISGCASTLVPRRRRHGRPAGASISASGVPGPLNSRTSYLRQGSPLGANAITATGSKGRSAGIARGGARTPASSPPSLVAGPRAAPAGSGDSAPRARDDPDFRARRLHGRSERLRRSAKAPEPTLFRATTFSVACGWIFLNRTSTAHKEVIR